MKNYMKEDHCNYRRNFYSCEKKACPGLYGIRTLDLCEYFSGSLFATAKVASITDDLLLLIFHLVRQIKQSNYISSLSSYFRQSS